MHVEPKLVSFSEAAAVIGAERSEVTKCLVALDQPTIVPNLSGSRPVDKVAAALISWVGGGVQPANQSKLGMFDNAAPIWRFKQAIGAIEDPEAARAASSGLFLIEVFPALALVALESAYCQRYGAPKYNPANRKMFKLEHWHSVAETIRTFGSLRALEQLELWCSAVSANLMPRKSDQDKIDAMICGLIGLNWLVAPREQSVMIGDLDNGYMIAPAVNGIHERLVTAASKRSVPIR
ncbi:UNVERIFIED_ORG: putative RNase H-like nuclease [Rhizobium esperanzae]|nr:putative RNase H-like nuclease [Rhizobium esperanzae]